MTRQTLPSKRIDSSLSALAGLDRLDDVEAFEFGMAEIEAAIAAGVAVRAAKRLGPCPGLEVVAARARSCATSTARDRRAPVRAAGGRRRSPARPTGGCRATSRPFRSPPRNPASTRKRFIAMNMLAPPRRPLPWTEVAGKDFNIAAAPKGNDSDADIVSPAASGLRGRGLRHRLRQARSARTRSRRSRPAWTATPCWCFRTRTSRDEQQLAFTRQFGELENYATRRPHPASGRTAGSGRGHRRFLQPRQGRQDHVGRGPGLVLQARRPAVAFGQFVPPGAGEIFAAVGTGAAVMGRQHRIRRHARRLRRARRAHQGGGRGPGLPALADLLARGDRLHRTDRGGDRRVRAGAPAPGAHASGDRAEVAVPVLACRRDRGLDGARRRACSCAT